MAFIRLLIAFLIPPLAVYIQLGWSRHLALNVVLTLLGFVPGIIHAVYIMATRPPGLVDEHRFEHSTRPPRSLVSQENGDRSVTPRSDV